MAQVLREVIPSELTPEHILAAMERIDREGIPPGRDSRKFEVRQAGRVYPPKLLISLACEAASGQALPSGVFSGGAETNRFLQRLGFIVVAKGGDTVTDARVAKPTEAPELVEARPARFLSQEQLESLKEQLLSARTLYTWKELRRDTSLPPASAGAYGWFFKSIPRQVPMPRCFKRGEMTLLYVGVSPGRQRSDETLRSRLRFHYRGHAEGSTLRLSLGCLLEDELGTVLRRSGKRMIFAGAEERLSQWMAANTAVTWVELESPWVLEEYLLRTLDLPLNIEGNRNHPFCDQLRALRDRARKRAETLPKLNPR